jgi:hypothetical protein
VKHVFPDGTEFHLDSKGDLSGSRFWMIPGKEGEPRWILPHDTDNALYFLHQWQPYKLFSRIKWKFLLAAYSGKGLKLVPGVIPLRIVSPEKSDWKHLGWNSRNLPVPIIYVGTPGPSRKLVLALFDSEKKAITSIAKVPMGPCAGRAINHEADILNSLTNEKPERAPRSLFIDRQNGIATQEFFAGKPTGRILTENHVTFLLDLVIPGETISLSEVGENLRENLETLEHIDSKTRSVLENVLEDVDDPSPLPAVWEHGDFAPWNIKKFLNGSLRVIDWEASSRRKLPLFDLIFFQSAQMFLFGDKEMFPKSIKRLLYQYLGQLEIAPSLTKKIIKACIAQDWLRFHETGDWPRADFLLRTLISPQGDLA